MRCASEGSPNGEVWASFGASNQEQHYVQIETKGFELETSEAHKMTPIITGAFTEIPHLQVAGDQKKICLIMFARMVWLKRRVPSTWWCILV